MATASEGDLNKKAVTKQHVILLSHVGRNDNDSSNKEGMGREWFGQIASELKTMISDVKGKVGAATKPRVAVLDYGHGEINEYRSRVIESQHLEGVEFIDLISGQELRQLEEAHIIIVLGGHNARVGANLRGMKHANGSLVDTREGASKSSLTETIRKRVKGGDLKYIGMSAGAIAAGASLQHASEEGFPKNYRTGNDLPNIEQGDFLYKSKDGKTESALHVVDTLNILPFSVAPHFPSKTADNFHERLRKLQDIAEITAVPIVAIGDDAAVVVEGKEFFVRGKDHGDNHVYLFRKGQEPLLMKQGIEFSAKIS